MPDFWTLDSWWRVPFALGTLFVPSWSTKRSISEYVSPSRASRPDLVDIPSFCSVTLFILYKTDPIAAGGSWTLFSRACSQDAKPTAMVARPMKTSIIPKIMSTLASGDMLDAFRVSNGRCYCWTSLIQREYGSYFGLGPLVVVVQVEVGCRPNRSRARSIKFIKQNDNDSTWDSEVSVFSLHEYLNFEKSNVLQVFGCL